MVFINDESAVSVRRMGFMSQRILRQDRSVHRKSYAVRLTEKNPTPNKSFSRVEIEVAKQNIRCVHENMPFLDMKALNMRL